MLCESPTPGAVELRLKTWTAAIDPATLQLQATLDGDHRRVILSAGQQPQAFRKLTHDGSSAGWDLPQLDAAVRLFVVEDHLLVRFETSREQKLVWPRTGEDPAFSALIFPDGAGLYIPLTDRAWRERLLRDPCRSASGGLSMPFWSYAAGRRTFTFLAVSDIRTEVCLATRKGGLSVNASHSFLKRDGAPPYEIEIWPGGESPIAPAIEYREWLIRKGRYVPLSEKIRANPSVSRLLGAEHMYLYGDGRTLEFLRALQRLGISKAWLGYDQDPREPGPLVTREFVEAAEAQGYLVGPYDSFANAQPAKTADSPNNVWSNGLYPSGCIVDTNGRIVKGFAGRGCEVSSQALARAEAAQHNLSLRADQLVRDGANSYFLDVDAFGDLYDDYSRSHAMTMFRDRENRLERMRTLQSRGLVLGSEEGVGWSAPVIDFAHGAFSVQNAFLWGNKRIFGGWWPPARPPIFFREVAPPPEFAAAKYDPVYRIPLYEAAFHGAVIATDRWDTPLGKFPDLLTTRTLLELLYNVPSIWSMDLRQLEESGAFLARRQRFFAALHQRAGLEPLTAFEWLTADRKVQRSRFGNDLTVTANFEAPSRAPLFEPVRPGCVLAHWISSGEDLVFCADTRADGR